MITQCCRINLDRCRDVIRDDCKINFSLLVTAEPSGERIGGVVDDFDSVEELRELESQVIIRLVEISKHDEFRGWMFGEDSGEL